MSQVVVGGSLGWNVDLALFGPNQLDLVLHVLRSLDLPEHTWIDVEGKRIPVVANAG